MNGPPKPLDDPQNAGRGGLITWFSDLNLWLLPQPARSQMRMVSRQLTGIKIRLVKNELQEDALPCIAAFVQEVDKLCEAHRYRLPFARFFDQLLEEIALLDDI